MSVEQAGRREYRVFDSIDANGTLSLIAPDEGCLIHVTEFEDSKLRKQLSAANTGSRVALRLAPSEAEDSSYLAERPADGVSVTLNPPCRLPDRAGEWESPAMTMI
jgi:hypothetical protein